MNPISSETAEIIAVLDLPSTCNANQCKLAWQDSSALHTLSSSIITKHHHYARQQPGHS
jgi:hypothetical protein